MSNTPKPLVLLIALLMVTWVPTVMATDSDGDGVNDSADDFLTTHVRIPIQTEMVCRHNQLPGKRRGRGIHIL